MKNADSFKIVKHTKCCFLRNCVLLLLGVSTLMLKMMALLIENRILDAFDWKCNQNTTVPSRKIKQTESKERKKKYVFQRKLCR